MFLSKINFSKKTIKIFATILSAIVFMNFISCQVEGNEDDNSDSLVTLVFAKEGDESPADCILFGEHGKSYFSVTGYKRKSTGLGLEKIDLMDHAKIKIISRSSIPCNIEITDEKKFMFTHGMDYEIECTLDNYNNTAKLKLTAVKQFDMYGPKNVEQTLIKGLIYPYHQIYTSFTNESCTISQNQMGYLDEKLGEQFSMFAGPSILSLEKINSVKNLLIDDKIKNIYIYGKSDLERASSDYLSIKISSTIEEMSDEYPLTIVNYRDNNDNEHKFENQKKSITVTNYGSNLFMQAGLGNGYVMITDVDGKICDNIKFNIHEGNYSNGKWASSDIEASNITKNNPWIPNKAGTFYVEVICTIDGKNYSNVYSTANQIKVTNE